MAATRELPCSDDAVKEKTGRSWAEWEEILDADARHLSHAELANLIDTMHDAGGWWSQTVAVGFERMTGKRRVGQSADGRFAASASKTLPVSAGRAHSFFVDEGKRTQWLAEPVAIRKATAPKSVRITWPDESSVEVWISEKGEAKCTVAVEHKKLDNEADAVLQKARWKEALARLASVIS